MENFWKKQKNNFLAIAPMAGITDSAFRQVCISFGSDINYSEMASVDALNYSPNKTLELLYFTEMERPYVVQLFGTNPKYFEKAVALLDKRIKPDGYDINFGCPVKKVIKQGAGAALMADLRKSKEIIKATIESTDKPISVKTRTKSGEVQVLDFIRNIEDLDISAIMVHGRTFKQGFSGEIDCAAIKKVKEEFNGLVIANGGVNDLESAKSILKNTGADGLGLARGILGRPWLFEEIKTGSIKNYTKKEVFDIALRHSKLMYEIKGECAIPELRKHLSWYMRGLEGASELRLKAVSVKTIDEVRGLLELK